MELKNKLLVLAAAAAVFLSCSKEQVMDDITVPSGHGLSFVLSGSGYEGAGDNGRETIRFPGILSGMRFATEKIWRKDAA